MLVGWQLGPNSNLVATHPSRLAYRDLSELPAGRTRLLAIRCILDVRAGGLCPSLENNARSALSNRY